MIDYERPLQARFNGAAGLGPWTDCHYVGQTCNDRAVIQYPPPGASNLIIVGENWELRNKPTPVSRWINVYVDLATGGVHRNRARADQAAIGVQSRIALVELIIEGEDVRTVVHKE